MASNPNENINIVFEQMCPNDPNSFSNPESVHAKRIKLRWNVDFDKKVITGFASYELFISNPAIENIIFDAKDLTIKGVTEVAGGKKLEFWLGKSVLTFGQPLTIKLPPLNQNDVSEIKMEIEVEYETAPDRSQALQWLEKEQTTGKEFPYLFSQCQPIAARSLLPCQDTPSTKASYYAEVTAPKELKVLMSAVRLGEPEGTNSDQRVHKFEQKIPIPSYLIAIVVGNIESKEIGPRSRVWAEKEFLEEAAFEFSETEQMIQAGEELMGDYVWGVYDILVLPPSFAYGGMENPCLTFATPTLLAGDKSLASTIAHEISHSWTGNLVTNKNFEHFWLNEGFTVFMERKILGLLHGEKYRQLASIGGWKFLNDVVTTMKPDNPLTCLVPNLKGIDPDDAFSRVPYEKGYTLLYYLEQKVGGPDEFEPFLKTYIQANRIKSIETDDFKQQFIKYFTKEGKENLIQDVDWNGWFYTPGMPLVKPDYDSTLLDVCTKLKNRWMEWNLLKVCPFQNEDLVEFSSIQIIEFLTCLLDEETPIETAKVKAMQQVYNFNAMKNSEIRYRWLRLCIKARWTEQISIVFKFVTEQGRMKYIRPLYRDMYSWEEIRSQAIKTFEQNRPYMMHVAVDTVSKDLNLN